MSTTKDMLYAAVGAPVAAAKAVNARFETLRENLGERTGDLTERLEKLVDEWADEGRQVVGKVSDGKVVDELAAKVDFDQAREQVGKLRDQLEDMLATWRTSFRPENGTAAPEAEKVTEEKPKAAPKAPAKKPAAKKPAAKSTTAAKKPAAKATKTTAAKASTAKSTATKSTADKAKTEEAADKAS